MNEEEMTSLTNKEKNKPIMDARDIIDALIQRLLRERDFLGLQLDYAWGNISAEEFKQRAQKLKFLV